RGSLDLARVRRLGRGPVRVEVVGGDDLDDLVLLRAPDGRQVACGGEVLLLPLPPRDRLVGDVADDVLEERVLAALGRPRIGLNPEHLLTHERGERGFEGTLIEPADGGEALLRERLPEDGAVLHEPPSAGASPSSRAATSACSVSGTSRVS